MTVTVTTMDPMYYSDSFGKSLTLSNQFNVIFFASQVDNERKKERKRKICSFAEMCYIYIAILCIFETTIVCSH